MPEVLTAISRLQIKVVFARQEIDKTEKNPNSVDLKKRAMQKVLSKFYSNYPEQSWKNVISIGDSAFERQALSEVVMNHNEFEDKKCRCKTVKLAEAPDLTQLNSQLDLLCSGWLKKIVTYDDNCDIDLNGSIDALLKWKKLLNRPNN